MSYQPTPIDQNGAVPTGSNYIVDVANSSTVPLLANGVFTGPSTNVLSYAQVAVTIISDQASATDGLQIQFSTDGVNWDHTHSLTFTPHVTSSLLQSQFHSKFYRVVYTNGTVNQTLFRLQSILHPFSGNGSIIESDAIVKPSDDALVVKSILTGKNILTGNYVDVRATPEGGLLVNQDIAIDASNSSTVNLTGGATYVGATASNITASMIQVFFDSDQNCTVYLDQSQDGTNWDISDSYKFYASIGNFGINVGAFGAYYRVRVHNDTAITTTHFRLQSITVPIANQLPRSLSGDGWLQTQVNQVTDRAGFTQYYSPNGEAIAVPIFQLVGSAFPDSTLDTNFWTPSPGTGGTVAVTAGTLTLSTGTSANNATSAQTVRNARFVAGAINKFRSSVQISDTGTVNNTRRIGAFNVNDGAFFELAGTEMAVVTRKAGVDTRVINGTFNGKIGTTYALDTNTHVYEIMYTPFRVFFFIDGITIHSQRFNTSWSSTTNLPVRIENFNTGGSTTNVSLNAFIAFITRLGPAETQPLGKNIAGAVTQVLKSGAGNLQSVVINANTGTSITLYDNTAASGTIIATIAPNQIVSLDFKGISFSTGLTIVTIGAGINCTVIYE
jgi:hypothetical protein